MDVRQSDAVARLVDRYFAAVRRVEWFVHIVQSHAGFAVRAVQLNDDLVCQTADSRRDTAGSRQIDFAVRSQFAGFDNGYVHFPHEAVTHFLCHL